jgi:hypothetical protein
MQKPGSFLLSVRPRSLLTGALALALLGACAAPQPLPLTAPAAPLPPHETERIEIKAIDFGYVMPVRAPRGLATLRFSNEGHELHHALIMRLNAGVSRDDVYEALNQSPLLLARVAATIGAVGDMAHGGHAETTLDLRPGIYTLVCFMPSLDGKLHVTKGMIGFFDVTAE